MKSSDGKTYPDLPENSITKIRFYSDDGQFQEMQVRARGDSWKSSNGISDDTNVNWNGFDSGKLGYNVPGTLEWNGLKFTVSCNLILKGSDSPERIVLGRTAQLLKDAKRIKSTLSNLDVPKVRHDRIVELVQQEGMSTLEAIDFAAKEAIDNHVPPHPNGHATA